MCILTYNKKDNLEIPNHSYSTCQKSKYYAIGPISLKCLSSHIVTCFRGD